MQTALITGATGFLGRQVASRLLAEDPELHLVALIRARPGDDGQLEERRSRIVRALADPAHAARLDLLRGDVEHDRLGLDAQAYDALAARVERVVHVAATTRFDHPLDEARRINVGGTERALELCRAVRARGGGGRLDYVGTAYVAGDRDGVVGEDELDAGQRFRNTYEQSKFESERLVRAARARDGLPVAIHRPSIIVGDSRTGATTSWNTIYWPMKVLVRFYGLWDTVLPHLVRLPVQPGCALDVVPVDWVASCIARLYNDPAAAGRSYHLAAGHEAPTIEEVVNICCDHFGVARLGYVDPDGPARLLARAARPLLSRAAPRLVRNGEMMLAYTRRNPRFDTANARAAGLRPPPVEDYFKRLVQWAYDRDFGRRNGHP
jgi:thioester reductase-like protein